MFYYEFFLKSDHENHRILNPTFNLTSWHTKQLNTCLCCSVYNGNETFLESFVLALLHKLPQMGSTCSLFCFHLLLSSSQTSSMGFISGDCADLLSIFEAIIVHFLWCFGSLSCCRMNSWPISLSSSVTCPFPHYSDSNIQSYILQYSIVLTMNQRV